MTDPTVSDDRLATIRNLLTKAEATTYPHEAEAFTAKASELMARYSIDEALLWARGQGNQDEPTERQITIRRPFLVQKGYLVSVVASASGCRSVRYMGGKGAETEVVSIVGFGTDLAMLETLITSLFVQLTTSMTSLSPQGLTGAQVSAWRRSFIMGFAETVSRRIEESRLAASSQGTSTSDEASGKGPSSGRERAAPSTEIVLAKRSDAVDAELRKRYPRLGQSRVSVGSSSSGRDEGKRAGRSADIGRRGLRSSKALAR